MSVGPDSEILGGSPQGSGNLAPDIPASDVSTSSKGTAGGAFTDLPDTDRALSKGVAAAETSNLVGMGLVQSTMLNRSDLTASGQANFLARGSSVAEIVAAPRTPEEALGGIVSGRGISNASGNQFAPLINRDIEGASKSGYTIAREVALNELDPSREIRDPRIAELAEKSQLAADVIYAAHELGIDASNGVTNYGAPGSQDKAGASNGVNFGGRGEVQAYGGGFFRGGSPSDFASAFAAAASLAGLSIPSSWFQSDIAPYASPDQINAQAQGMLTVATSIMGNSAFPGLSYQDGVTPTGFNAIDVPNVTAQPDQIGLGQSPIGNIYEFGRFAGLDPYSQTQSPLGAVDRGPDLAPPDDAQQAPQGAFPFDASRFDDVPGAYSSPVSLDPWGQEQGAYGGVGSFSDPVFAGNVDFGSAQAQGSPEAYNPGYSGDLSVSPEAYSPGYSGAVPSIGFGLGYDGQAAGGYGGVAGLNQDIGASGFGTMTGSPEAYTPGYSGDLGPSPEAYNPGYSGNLGPSPEAYNPGYSGDLGPSPEAYNPGYSGGLGTSPEAYNPGYSGDLGASPEAYNPGYSGNLGPSPEAYNPGYSNPVGLGYNGPFSGAYGGVGTFAPADLDYSGVPSYADAYSSPPNPFDASVISAGGLATPDSHPAGSRGDNPLGSVTHELVAGGPFGAITPDTPWGIGGLTTTTGFGQSLPENWGDWGGVAGTTQDGSGWGDFATDGAGKGFGSASAPVASLSFDYGGSAPTGAYGGTTTFGQATDFAPSAPNGTIGTVGTAPSYQGSSPMGAFGGISGVPGGLNTTPVDVGMAATDGAGKGTGNASPEPIPDITVTPADNAPPGASNGLGVAANPDVSSTFSPNAMGQGAFGQASFGQTATNLGGNFGSSYPGAGVVDTGYGTAYGGTQPGGGFANVAGFNQAPGGEVVSNGAPPGMDPGVWGQANGLLSGMGIGFGGGAGAGQGTQVASNTPAPDIVVTPSDNFSNPSSFPSVDDSGGPQARPDFSGAASSTYAPEVMGQGSFGSPQFNPDALGFAGSPSGFTTASAFDNSPGPQARPDFGGGFAASPDTFAPEQMGQGSFGSSQFNPGAVGFAGSPSGFSTASSVDTSPGPQARPGELSGLGSPNVTSGPVSGLGSPGTPSAAPPTGSFNFGPAMTSEQQLAAALAGFGDDSFSSPTATSIGFGGLGNAPGGAFANVAGSDFGLNYSPGGAMDLGSGIGAFDPSSFAGADPNSFADDATSGRTSLFDFAPPDSVEQGGVGKGIFGEVGTPGTLAAAMAAAGLTAADLGVTPDASEGPSMATTGTTLGAAAAFGGLASVMGADNPDPAAVAQASEAVSANVSANPSNAAMGAALAGVPGSMAGMAGMPSATSSSLAAEAASSMGGFGGGFGGTGTASEGGSTSSASSGNNGGPGGFSGTGEGNSTGAGGGPGGQGSGASGTGEGSGPAGGSGGPGEGGGNAGGAGSASGGESGSAGGSGDQGGGGDGGSY